MCSIRGLVVALLLVAPASLEAATLPIREAGPHARVSVARTPRAGVVLVALRTGSSLATLSSRASGASGTAFAATLSRFGLAQAKPLSRGGAARGRGADGAEDRRRALKRSQAFFARWARCFCASARMTTAPFAPPLGRSFASLSAAAINASISGRLKSASEAITT